MKLEYGKRYVTRNGRITSPLIQSIAQIYPFRCTFIGMDWAENGKVYADKDADLDIVREYAEQADEPAKQESTMQTRVVKMAVLPKGEPIFSELTTMIEIEDVAAGEFLVISQEGHDKGKISISPEEWPAIKAAIETMFGYIEEAEVENE